MILTWSAWLKHKCKKGGKLGREISGLYEHKERNKEAVHIYGESMDLDRMEGYGSNHESPEW